MRKLNCREIQMRKRKQLNLINYVQVLEKQAYVDQNREDEILKGNPLLVTEDYSLKKK